MGNVCCTAQTNGEKSNPKAKLSSHKPVPGEKDVALEGSEVRATLMSRACPCRIVSGRMSSQKPIVHVIFTLAKAGGRVRFLQHRNLTLKTVTDFARMMQSLSIAIHKTLLAGKAKIEAIR